MSGEYLQVPHAGWFILITLGVVVQLFTVSGTRRSPARKVTLSLLNVLFGALLWLFLQPPSYLDDSTTLTLITPGSTTEQIRQAQRGRKVVAIDPDRTLGLDRGDVTRHLDLLSVRLAHPDATALNVVGPGLDGSQWNMDRTWNVRFDGAAPSTGLRHAHWPRRHNVGDPMVMSGHVAGLPGAAVQLIDPAGDLVERARLNTDGTFTLTDSPRSVGRFIYRLEIIDRDEKLIASEPMPVHIAEPEPINLLMVLSSPSFESRSLKNWASRGGASLVIRTKISKERYLDEFIARDSVPSEQLDQLSPSLLATFDAVIIDQRGWRELAPDVRDSLYVAIDQSGLGLAVLAHDAQHPLDAKNRLPMLLPYTERDRSLDLDTPVPDDSTVSLAPARFEFNLTDQEAVLSDDSGLPVIVAQQLGRGRTAVTLVTNSHTLITAGQNQLHARYWQTLVEAVAPSVARPNIEVWPNLPRVNRQVQFCLYGERIANEMTVNASTGIPLKPQAYRPGERCGYWWPEQTGWHTLSMPGFTHQVFVFPATDWLPLRHAAATTATLLAAQREPDRLGDATPPARDMPRWWFACLALIVAGALWLEQKLQQ